MPPFLPLGTPGLVVEGLPRQFTALRGDPHFEPSLMKLSERIDVLLDGEVLPEVARYDVDLGRVDRNERGPDGCLVLERGAPKLETLYGLVEVRWAKGAKP